MNSPNEAGPPARDDRRRWLLVLALLAALLALGVWLRSPARLQLFFQQLLEWVRQLGVWAPVVFITLYIASCVALLPAAILTLSAGALFGVIQGSIYVSVGATLGATAAFLVGRHAVRDWVSRKLAK